ncbi:LacI family DNA-binding transcriptional regulator [Salinicoccus luteus]|uniref:LacI family DNA-binding transcriptional regulator n=1 Tax=Salinicoccus luteus TaxID=367840 RepID=UPI0004E185EC|nr:LacI family DNA-binding transcriptional regulator [Salinicoccus luteus]
MKKVTIKDVAREAGVSTSTVSQYLNGRYHYMGEETKERVFKAIESLGYRPNYMARNLKSASTKTIGIIVSNILHHFAVGMTRKIEDYCDRDGYNLIICNADDDPKKERKYIDGLLEKQVDGLIIMPTRGNDDLYRKLAAQQFPIVFIDRYVKDIDIPAFKLDNHQAISLALDHLKGRAVEHFYYIGASDDMALTPRIERLEAFRNIAERMDASHHAITDTNDALYRRIEAEFKERPSSGIVLANDFALMAFLEYANAHSLNLEAENHLVAIDDLPLANVYRPKITTIAQPIENIAEEAYRTVMGRVENETSTEHRIHSYKGALMER